MTITGPRRLGASTRPPLAGMSAAAGVGVVGAVCAYLVAGGKAWLAFGLLLALPLFYILHRRPLAVVALWLLITPYLVDTDGGGIRKVYWLVHRALPVVVLLVVLIAPRIGIGPTRLARLGWPEALMAGYLGVTVLSVLFTSPEVLATAYHVYDRIFVPMCLYLIVRLLEPDEGHLRALLPVVAFLLISQSVYGILSWVAPEVLPSAWLGREGLRTTGSLRHPNVYGVSLLAAGLLALHHVMNAGARRPMRWLLGAMLPVAIVMAFMTYSRASWLVVVVVLAGVGAMYRRVAIRFVAVAAVVLAALLATGVIAEQVETAQNRFRSEQSEESALSRLPVVWASVRMFGEKPLLGWGYDNFDRYDRQFQGVVGDLVVPEKDHASHNLYLTILAEQGLLGLSLYIAPALIWLARTPAAYRAMPARGLISGRLLVALWIVIAGHVVVSNFANMRVVFGLGTWWLTLGMIAVLVSRHRPAGSGKDRDATAHSSAPWGPEPRASNGSLPRTAR